MITKRNAGKAPFLKLVETISIVKFRHVARKYKGDMQKVFDDLLDNGLDDLTMGFWVWNIPEHTELYSPKFRSSIGYEGEHDFPSTPDSWQKAIQQKSLDMAVLNFNQHVESRGEHNYTQVVTYNKKHGGTLTVDCHGAVSFWDGDNPVLMIGVHLEPE